MLKLIETFDMKVTTETEQETRYAGFVDNGSRYPFDDYLMRRGFQQWDTSQDAWYFGVWVNPNSYEIVNYCEGDLYFSIYKTKAAFEAEVRRLEKFYGDPPPAFICYSFNENGATRKEIIDDRYSPE
mgnify:CR=1 FL=1